MSLSSAAISDSVALKSESNITIFSGTIIVEVPSSEWVSVPKRTADSVVSFMNVADTGISPSPE